MRSRGEPPRRRVVRDGSAGSVARAWSHRKTCPSVSMRTPARTMRANVGLNGRASCDKSLIASRGMCFTGPADAECASWKVSTNWMSERFSAPPMSVTAPFSSGVGHGELDEARHVVRRNEIDGILAPDRRRPSCRFVEERCAQDFLERLDEGRRSQDRPRELALDAAAAPRGTSCGRAPWDVRPTAPSAETKMNRSTPVLHGRGDEVRVSLEIHLARRDALHAERAHRRDHDAGAGHGAIDALRDRARPPRRPRRFLRPRVSPAPERARGRAPAPRLRPSRSTRMLPQTPGAPGDDDHRRRARPGAADDLRCRLLRIIIRLIV